MKMAFGAAVAVMERAPSMQPMRRQPFVPVITARDCELLRRLPVWCRIRMYYAFALRLRFLPDVPEEIILYLLAEQPHVGGVRLEQSLAEQAQLLQALLEESPQLERSARDFCFKSRTMQSCVPAHLPMRWRLALTQQRLWLASTAQARAPFLQELKEIRHLNQGRLGVEAEAALDRAQRRARLISLRERALAKHSVSGLPEMVQATPARRRVCGCGGGSVLCVPVQLRPQDLASGEPDARRERDRCGH